MTFRKRFETVIVSNYDTSHLHRPPAVRAASPCGFTTPQRRTGVLLLLVVWLLPLLVVWLMVKLDAEHSTPAAPPGDSGSPKLPEATLHGLAGLAFRTMAPNTDAHPASLLPQLLAVFGNIVGRGPHCMVDATRHSLNLYVVLVGDSSKARKDTSWSQIDRLFAEVDQPWLSTRVTSARLTGLWPRLCSARSTAEASDDGLSKYQIRRLFHGHEEGNRIDAALETLVALGALNIHSEATGGRPSTRWSANERISGGT